MQADGVLDTAHETHAPAITVKEVVASWPASRWQRLSVAEGAKGTLTYDWACQRVVESRDRLPGREVWLLARRLAERHKRDRLLSVQT